MNKYIIGGVLGVGVLVLLFGLGKYSLLDTEYLFGWGRFAPFPEEVRQKHITTIEKVDAFIMKENASEVTSHSEKFNLENYLGIIEIGVLPYIKAGDPFAQDVRLLVEDIRRYNKDKGRKNY